MSFNHFNGGNQGRISERDRLELDENGRTRSETNTLSTASGSDSGNSRKGWGGSSGGTSRGISKFKVLVAVGCVGGLVYLGSLGNGGFIHTLKSFMSTPEENAASMLTAVKKVENDNKMVGKEKDRLYDVNNIYSDEVIQLQVDKEYAVLVYTGEEDLDAPFREWVLTNDKKIPIYRLHASGVQTNDEVLDYLEPNVPMVLIYNEVGKGKKELDAVIKDAELLNNVIPHIHDLQKKKEAQKSKDKNGK